MYLVRRLGFVIVAFFMTESTYFQIVVTYYLTLGGLVYLVYTRPYDTRS